MSSHVSTSTDTSATVRPVFRGRARWIAAVLLVTGTALQLVEFLLERPIDDSQERVDYWTSHIDRIGASMAAGIVAVPFLIGGFAIIVALCIGRTPRLAWTAAAFLTMAMVGLAAIHGAEATAYGLVRAGERSAAATALAGEDLGAPGVALFVMFLSGAFFGVLTIAAAMWLSPLVPRVSAVLVIAFVVFDFALGYGAVSHALNLLGFSIVAWAVVTGYTRAGTGTSYTKLPRPRARRGRTTTREPSH
jgi:hypothetical protein